ncbi:hypothetical protein CVU82_02650 [Candidatus Falkowbacteria bacterium HGW-Falkowbacteria-1]|jgi:phytol kinase|uniref:Phosphatidate cytidylyltransferase n=1 Tax=Candidatus Falkowbacteria bacterium HGW-Falkowbacteria-1 TaxID=2013768 RepID=A0A2N2E9X2_9BACT|nr:MAG: hypothetical protein CVU82_02650 [Candidatus Falkowbacteria bacterium HGW-Falkowbacteria-1]
MVTFVRGSEKIKIDNFNRKIIHIISAFVICLFPYFLNFWQIMFLSLFFSFVFLMARLSGFLPIINRVKRVSLGEIFYPIGVMVSAFLFLPQGEIRAFQFGILVLGLSDAFANIFGDLFGVHKIDLPWSKKSLEGSLAFFLSTLMIIIIFNSNFDILNLSIYFSVSLILTIIEFLLFFGLDNLVLPIISSYLFLLLT